MKPEPFDVAGYDMDALQEAIQRFNATVTIATAEPTEEPPPVPKLCWGTEPLGTVAQEHPRSSPPRSPTGSFGGRKVVQGQAVDSSPVNIEDID